MLKMSGVAWKLNRENKSLKIKGSKIKPSGTNGLPVRGIPN